MAKDIKKEEAARRLLLAWKCVPELRLAQLIFNATNGEDIFYLEDAVLVQKIESYISKGKG